MNTSMNPNTLLLLGMSQDKIKKMSSNVVIPQPDYSIQSPDYFPTKTAPNMSEEEYEEAIREQAKKDALAGIPRIQSNASIELLREYESIASPDRKGIISSTIKKLSSSTSKTQLVTFASFKDSTGREVARYSGNQGMWYANATPEEGARGSKFTSIYFKAYQEALDGKNGSLNISV